MEFVVLYCNKNQYEMFEKFAFKYSPVDFSKVNILVYDDNSIPEQQNILKNLCKKYSNIKWINPNVSKNAKMPNTTCIKVCDEYLTNNNININWILFLENDVFPFQENFWDLLNDKIKNNTWLNKKVGSFGFSSYQYYSKGIQQGPGNPVPGRGNLVNNILESPHGGWYKDLPLKYYNNDYFVIEVPNWQSICVNRNLFRKYIRIDERYDNRILNHDDMAHQFMLYGLYNICFPKLAVCHDGDNKLKEDIKIINDKSYSRSNKCHDIFEERWGWRWGKRNTNLRNQFSNILNNSDFYSNTLQEKLFQTHINEGPKTIKDFE